MALTLDEVRRLGLEALRARLGRAGMVRFLQQFETGSGDDASERRAWVDRVSLDEIRAASGRSRPAAKRPGRRRGARRAP